MRQRWNLATILGVIICVLVAGSFGLYRRSRIAGGASGQITNQSSGSMRWGLEEIKAPSAWEITRGSREVTVAVIDSGIDREIAGIRRNIWVNEDEVPGDGIDNDDNGYVDDVHGWDFRDGDSDSMDGSSLYYHGTFVAGLVASSVTGERGMAGVAPEINIMDVRFLNSRGNFFTSDWGKLSDAIDYAVDNGADIINLSIYASRRPPSSVHRAMRRASRRGVLIVGIAGNDGSSVGYFGKWDEVMTVGAVDKSKSPAGFSNYGSAVEVAAPGVHVLSYLQNGRLTTASGTSFAAPHVSGTAALLRSLRPEMTANEVRELIVETARDVYKSGWDSKTGNGIVDATRVVSGNGQ